MFQIRHSPSSVTHIHILYTFKNTITIDFLTPTHYKRKKNINQKLPLKITNPGRYAPLSLVTYICVINVLLRLH